jgi:hypothetical protein
VRAALWHSYLFSCYPLYSIPPSLLITREPAPVMVQLRVDSAALKRGKALHALLRQTNGLVAHGSERALWFISVVWRAAHLGLARKPVSHMDASAMILTAANWSSIGTWMTLPPQGDRARRGRSTNRLRMARPRRSRSASPTVTCARA